MGEGVWIMWKRGFLWENLGMKCASAGEENGVYLYNGFREFRISLSRVWWFNKSSVGFGEGQVWYGQWIAKLIKVEN